MNQSMLMKKPTQRSAVEATSWPPLLTLSQAVSMTGLSAKYIMKIRRAGVIPVYKLHGGTKSRYRRDELLKHLEL